MPRLSTSPSAVSTAETNVPDGVTAAAPTRKKKNACSIVDKTNVNNVRFFNEITHVLTCYNESSPLFKYFVLRSLAILKCLFNDRYNAFLYNIKLNF